MKELQLRGGGLKNRTLQTFSGFWRWTERELRFQLIAPAPPLPRNMRP